MSDDNPFSEAHFKTLKYCPQFPENFGYIQNARAFCRDFFTWYNQEHRHTGIGLMTPEQVHYGRAKEIYQCRTDVLQTAFERFPLRFKGKEPKLPQLPQAGSIKRNMKRAKNQSLI